MDDPLKQAKSELRQAEKALKRMSEADNFEDLEDEWKVLLGSIEKCWVKAERGCQHIRNQFQPWQGKFARDRKKDPLLRYLKHARNSDSHTIQETLQKKDASSSLYIEGGPGLVTIDNLEIKDGKLVSYKGSHPLIFENLPNRIELVKVKDNSKWYNPPKEHMGIKLVWPAPLDVASMAIEYYRNYLAAIESKFFSKTGITNA